MAPALTKRERRPFACRANTRVTLAGAESLNCRRVPAATRRVGRGFRVPSLNRLCADAKPVSDRGVTRTEMLAVSLAEFGSAGRPPTRKLVVSSPGLVGSRTRVASAREPEASEPSVQVPALRSQAPCDAVAETRRAPAGARPEASTSAPRSGPPVLTPSFVVKGAPQGGGCGWPQAKAANSARATPPGA